MQHFQMLLGVWVILRLLIIIKSLGDNRLINFLRALQVVYVRGAVRAIDNKYLFLIRIFPVKF